MELEREPVDLENASEDNEAQKISDQAETCGEDSPDGGEPDVQVEIQKLTSHLCEVLDSMYANLGNLLQSGTLESFASELFSVKIISEDVKNNPDFKKITGEFQSSMLFMKNVGELEDLCRGFLQALGKSGGSGGPTTKAAEKLEEEWSEVILRELGIHFIKSSYQASTKNDTDGRTHRVFQPTFPSSLPPEMPLSTDMLQRCIQRNPKLFNSMLAIIREELESTENPLDAGRTLSEIWKSQATQQTPQNTHETVAETASNVNGDNGSWSNSAIMRNTSLRLQFTSSGHSNDHHPMTDPCPSVFERPDFSPQEFSHPILPDSVMEEQESYSHNKSYLVSAQQTGVKDKKISNSPARSQSSKLSSPSAEIIQPHTKEYGNNTEMVNSTSTLQHSALFRPIEEELDKLKKELLASNATYSTMIEREMNSLKNTIDTQVSKVHEKLGKITSMLETKVAINNDSIKGSSLKNKLAVAKQEKNDLIAGVIKEKNKTIYELKVTIAIVAVVLVTVMLCGLYCFHNSFVSQMASYYKGDHCPN